MKPIHFNVYGRSVGALWAEPGQVASAALAVFLADEAQPAGTVQVVEAPILSQVGTVLISRTQTVLCPAVRLTGSPVSASAEHKRADTRTALPVYCQSDRKYNMKLVGLE